MISLHDSVGDTKADRNMWCNGSENIKASQYVDGSWTVEHSHKIGRAYAAALKLLALHGMGNGYYAPLTSSRIRGSIPQGALGVFV